MKQQLEITYSYMKFKDKGQEHLAEKKRINLEN